MTTDAQATYYDLEINGATIEARDIVRAVLERAGLGADASHQLGKVLERCIRLGAKPGTDVGREVEKIRIEAGMLRDAMAAHLATPDPMVTALDAVDASAIFNAPAGMEDAPGNEVVEPITDDDAEDAARVDLERERNSLSAERRSWHDGNRALSAERQLDEARARIAELERERDKWEKRSRGAEADLNEAVRQKQEAMKERDRLDRNVKGWREVAELAGRERDEAREDAAKAKNLYNDLFDSARKEMEALKERLSALRERAEKAERELAGVVGPEQLQRWRTALSASPTETLTNAICRVTSELAALRETYDAEMAFRAEKRTQLGATETEGFDEFARRVCDELAALRDRYRPRRQIEEPAPAGVPVLQWSHSDKKCDLGVWFWRMGENVPPDGIWTHQPPAPEAEREGE